MKEKAGDCAKLVGVCLRSSIAGVEGVEGSSELMLLAWLRLEGASRHVLQNLEPQQLPMRAAHGPALVH